MTECNRCEKPIDETEACWWCLSPLCPECWDQYGHCGHPEADEYQATIMWSLEDKGRE